MKLYMATTHIEAEQTIGEIQKMLSNHGVKAMMTEYDGPHVESVSFKMEIDGHMMGFKMPCNWRSVHQIMKTDSQARASVRLKKGETLEHQSIRTAWRIIHRWIEAQLALVQVNMVTIPQVFLPYSIMRDGRTLAETVTDDPSFLLGSGQN